LILSRRPPSGLMDTGRDEMLLNAEGDISVEAQTLCGQLTRSMRLLSRCPDTLGRSEVDVMANLRYSMRVELVGIEDFT